MEEDFFRSVYAHCEYDVLRTVDSLCAELEGEGPKRKSCSEETDVTQHSYAQLKKTQEFDHSEML